MTFFVTSAGLGKGADLGGLEGADRQCQTLAQAAGAGSKRWRAYLSTQAVDGRLPSTLTIGLERDRGRIPSRFCLAELVAVRETLPDIELAFPSRTASPTAHIGRAQVQQRDRGLPPL